MSEESLREIVAVVALQETVAIAPITSLTEIHRALLLEQMRACFGSPVLDPLEADGFPSRIELPRSMFESQVSAIWRFDRLLSIGASLKPPSEDCERYPGSKDKAFPCRSYKDVGNPVASALIRGATNMINLELDAIRGIVVGKLFAFTKDSAGSPVEHATREESSP